MTKTTPLLFLLDVDFDLVSPISLAISASLREKTELQNPHRRGRRRSRAEYFVSGSDSSTSRPCQHSRSFVSIRGSNNLRKSAQSADEIWLRLCRARSVRASPPVPPVQDVCPCGSSHLAAPPQKPQKQPISAVFNPFSAIPHKFPRFSPKNSKKTPPSAPKRPSAPPKPSSPRFLRLFPPENRKPPC